MLLFFLTFGLFASWMASVAERGPLLWYAGLVMYLFGFLHLFGAFLLMTEPIRHALSLWHVSIPSVLALVAMSWALLRQHPQLRHELDVWVDADDEESAPIGDSRLGASVIP